MVKKEYNLYIKLITTIKRTLKYTKWSNIVVSYIITGQGNNLGLYCVDTIIIFLALLYGYIRI